MTVAITSSAETPLRTRVTSAMLEGVERDLILAYQLGGMRVALGALNARTRFRVTALCPLEPGPGARLVIYDRDHPRGQLDGSTRDLCSTAQAIAAEYADARVADSPHIERDTGTPRAAFASRAGSLVYTATGTVWGVLFHHDLRLRIAVPKERLVLEHLGRRLSTLFPAEIGA